MPYSMANTIDGSMVVLPNDTYVGASLTAYGEYCIGERLLAERYVRLSTIVVDAGANMGAHTLHLARIVGPQGFVYAFEPQPLLANIVRANLLLNMLERRCKVFTEALGSSRGEVFFPKLDYDAAYNFGGIGMQAAATTDIELQRVPLTTLDEYLNEAVMPVSFCKIDVEGAEADVLLGARRMLSRDRPVLLVENDRRHKMETLITVLKDLHYDPYWVLISLFNPANFNKNPKNIWGRGLVSMDMLALPAGMPPPRDIPVMAPTAELNARILASMQLDE